MSKQAASFAYALICTDLGRQATDEGWLSELWDFGYAEGREPSGTEVKELRKRAAAKWQDWETWPWPAAKQAVAGRFERLRKRAGW